jgi:hypothetical protein
MTSAGNTDLLLPPRRVLRALNMPTPSYQTLRQRGQLEGFFGQPTAGGYSRFTMTGFLALAAYRALTELKIEIPEMPPAAFLQYADLWLRTRGTGKPVREAVLRWYGRSNDENSKFSRALNEDVLTTQPDPGARVTIRLDLDAIFGEAEHALLNESEPRRPPEEILGLYGD